MDSVPKPSSAPSEGLSALARAVAPTAVRVTHCPGNALAFCVEWDARGSCPRFYGSTPDAAAREALGALRDGAAPGPTRHVTEPAGSSAYVEALREWIDRTERTHPTRPPLRIVPDQG